ncbi:MAG: hypothetical protein K9L64_05990 [Candidatus Izimaplasma sp.]|nr:hypothetical protein [Candidatus Izimaplasma bacterium]
MALSKKGKVYSWGSNSLGELGTGNYEDSALPIEITSNFDLTEDDRITNLYYCGVITKNGSLYKWDFGLIGNPLIHKDQLHPLPRDITYNFDLSLEDQLIDISTLPPTTNHALSKKGKIFAWGEAYLGAGKVTSSKFPLDITNNFSIIKEDKMIYVDSRYHFALSMFGRVYSWGYNGYFNASYPVDITEKFKLSSNDKIVCIYRNKALSKKGKVFTLDSEPINEITNDIYDKLPYPIEITRHFKLLEKDQIISLHDFQVLSKEGRVFSFGSGGTGILGTGKYENSAYPVDITDNFALSEDDRIIKINGCRALSKKGKVFTWGPGNSGELGNGKYENSAYPVDITDNFALSEDDRIIKINGCRALSKKGKVFTWGPGNFGELGNGKHEVLAYPVDITSNFDL